MKKYIHMMLKKTEEAASVSRGSIVAGNIPKYM